jgi:hypothetical protein
MKFRRQYPGSKVWTLKLFGGKHTYPVTVDFNFCHFGQKVYHGPFYDAGGLSLPKVKNVADHWGKKLFPLIWGTGGLLKCDTGSSAVTVRRLWLYSRWGTIGHIDIIINRGPRT